MGVVKINRQKGKLSKLEGQRWKEAQVLGMRPKKWEKNERKANRRGISMRIGAGWGKPGAGSQGDRRGVWRLTLTLTKLAGNHPSSSSIWPHHQSLLEASKTLMMSPALNANSRLAMVTWSHTASALTMESPVISLGDKMRMCSVHTAGYLTCLPFPPTELYYLWKTSHSTGEGLGRGKWHWEYKLHWTTRQTIWSTLH